jgi:Tfp pilus assembly protein PilO
MTSASDRKVVFALLIVVGLCLIGLGVSLYRDRLNELKSQQQTLSRGKARLADVKEKINRIPELESKFAKLQARMDFLEPSLPDAAYVPTFLKQIENLATSTGNEILMIRPKPKQKTAQAKGGGAVAINSETGEVTKSGGEATAKETGPKESEPPKLPYEFVPIEVKLGGTYSSAIDFLAALQRFPKMIAVNNLSFAPQPSQEFEYFSPRLTASLEMLAVVAKKGDKDGESG